MKASRFFGEAPASATLSSSAAPRSRFAKLQNALQQRRRQEVSEVQPSVQPGPETGEVCNICLSGLVNTATLDSCSHSFCLVCISLWARVNPTCPCCKKPFKVVQAVSNPDELHYFEPPLVDSDDESDEDEDREDEEDEEEEEEEGASSGNRQHDEDEYEKDGFVVGDDEEIEYESEPDELARLDEQSALLGLGLADSSSECGSEEGHGHGDASPKSRRRRRRKAEKSDHKRRRVKRKVASPSPSPSPLPSPLSSPLPSAPAEGGAQGGLDLSMFAFAGND